MRDKFAVNLRNLCANHPSTAQICRDIGINRQQFNRYLSGAGLPSAHNLRRIAQFFDVAERDFALMPAEFEARHVGPADLRRRGPNPADFLPGIFRNQMPRLRRYLGVYHAHFGTPTWPGYTFRSLVWLREQDGFVIGHTYERAVSKSLGIVQKVRHAGLAAFQGNRIYLIEVANSEDKFVSETILLPAYRTNVNLLRGLTTGVAAGRRMVPYSSATVWKKLPTKMTAREALSRTGLFRPNSEEIELAVRNALREAQEEFAGEQGAASTLGPRSS